MSLCPEHAKRAAMTDAEFWDYVFNPPGFQESWAHYAWAFSEDIYVISCARCGETCAVDCADVIERERDAFCDDCADDTGDLYVTVWIREALS